MSDSYWRNICKPIIAEVLKQTQGQSDNDIRKALYNAYPFGERKMHPYKIWLDEIQVQRGTKVNKRLKQERAELVKQGQLEML